MIRFLEDWQRYPHAVLHEETRNESAIKLALKLRKMGIQNHAFFLALHDKSLRNVNPYSDSLSVEQMVAIGLECKANPWYFFREVARAPALAGTEPSMIEFNRANISLWWSFFNHITYTLIQPRQTGKSFCTDLLMTELMNFLCTNTQINLLTKDDKLRGENIKRLKAIYEELPFYLKHKSKEDTNNTEEISIKKLRNYYITHVPQSSEKRAYNLGRGLTTPIFQMDEPPFQAWIEKAMPTALGAMGAAIDAAKRNNEPYGVILTTTAGKKDDRDGRYIFNYANASARWSERFYDAKNHIDLEVMVRRNSKENVFRIYGSFSYKQLGKTDAWMRSQLERANGTPEESNRDFFNVWTSGSQSAPLPVDVLERLSAAIVDEQHQAISTIGGYITRWYLPEEDILPYMQQKKTVCGIDTSDAVGEDGISFVLTDVETGNTVAVGEFNETNLITFAQWLCDMIITFPNMTTIIERRSSGVTIVDYLLMFLPQKGVDPFKRLFNWVVNDQLEHQDRYLEAQTPMNRRSMDLYVRSKKYFGFATSGSGETSRNELYGSIFQAAARRCAEKVKDRSLTEQITSLVNRNGRIDHEVGGHDDLVIGWLMCHWFLSRAKNLQHYGIDSRYVMVDAKPEKQLSPVEAFTEQEQQRIRMRITELSDLLTQESDQFMIERHERELRHLDSKLVLKDGEHFSIDAMMNYVKEERKKMRIHMNGYGQAKSYYEELGYVRPDRIIDGLEGGIMTQHRSGNSAMYY